MLPYIYVGILVVNIVAFLSKPQNNRYICFFTELFIILFVAGKRYTGSRIAADLYNYSVNYYNPVKYFKISPAYSILSAVGLKLGLDFYAFYTILIASVLIVEFRFIKREQSNLHLIYISYLLYFILIPMDLLKNQCAFLIFLLAFPYLLKDNKYENIKFILAMLGAILFHYSYVLFFLLFLGKTRIGRKSYKIAPILIVSFCVILVLTKQQGIIGKLIIHLLLFFPPNIENRFSRYLRTQTYLSSLGVILIYLIALILVNYWKKIMRTMIIGNSGVTVQPAKLVSLINWGAVYIPLLMVNFTMHRFIRDLTLVAIIFCGKGTLDPKSKLKDRFLILNGAVAISIGWFLLDIIIQGYWKDFLSNFFANVYMDF